MAPVSGAIKAKPPLLDGEVKQYPPNQGIPMPRPKTRIIYVNGVLTTGEAHMATAMLIADVVEGYVVGVHNLSGSDDSRDLMAKASKRIASAPVLPDKVKNALLAVGSQASSLYVALQDFSQCISDYALPMRAMKWVSESFLADWFTDSFRPPTDSEKYQMALLVLGANKATVELFKLLYVDLSAGRSVHLVAHSQGNLISVNALYALQWVLGSLKGLYYYGLASPSPSWPKELTGALFTHADDPVPRLSLGRSFKKDAIVEKGSKILPYSVAAHDVTQHILDTTFGKLIRSRLGLGDASQPGPAAAGPAKKYVVQKGDSLSKIAKSELGNTTRWREIYDRNKAVIGSNPDKISPGITLELPKK